MTLTIRRAQRGDIHTLIRLVRTVHQQHIDANPDRYKPLNTQDPALLQFYRDHLSNPEAHVFLAERNETSVGFLLAYLRHIPENPFIYTGTDFHIDQISVEAAHQSQGIGGRLMETALETARELDVDSVSLGVAAFNQRAVRFYERYGFEVSSLRMRRYL